MNSLVKKGTVELGEESGGSFQTATAGTHEARINALIELWFQPQVDYTTKLAKKPEPMIRVVFEVFEDDGSSALVTKDYTLTFGDKSKFPKMVNSAMGTSMTPQEVRAYMIETPLKDLVGRAVQLKIVHNEGKNKKVFANIDGDVMDLTNKARLNVPDAIKETFVFARNEDNAVEVFKTKLSPNARAKIMGAVNAEHYSQELKEAYLEIQMNSETQPDEVVKPHQLLG